MSAIRALVVDDEAHARDLLRSLLTRERDFEVVGEAALVRDVVAAAERSRPDVLFLDIQLPDGDGFTVLEALERSLDRPPEVVFVTAYDEFAVRAFEVHAVDYLLKPFDEIRLGETLTRVRARLGDPQTRGLRDELVRLRRTLEARPLQRIAVKCGDESLVVHTDDIDWLEAEENYVRVHAGGRSYLVRSTLQSLEQRLDPDRFVRLHRSTIAHVDRIRRLTPWGHGDLRVELTDGRQLKASRRYRDRLDRVLEMLR